MQHVLMALARQWACWFAIWTGLALTLIYQLYSNTLTYKRPFLLGAHVFAPLTRYWIYALVSPLIFFISTHFRFEHGRRITSTLAHIAGYVTTAAIYAYLRVLALNHLPGVDGVPSFSYLFKMMFKGLFSDQLWMYGSVVCGAYIYHYYSTTRERDRATEKLKTALAESQLQVLKLQLHPHFLFNTLNGISALMSSDVPQARTMVAELSDLLRAALRNGGAAAIPLRQELDFVRAYLGLQQMRLKDRLTMTIEAPEDAMDTPVPSMILQPIVENAIHHGIERLERGGRLELSIKHCGAGLRVRVSNDGPSVHEVGRTDGNGVGLRNTLERLQAFYGQAQNITIEDRTEGGANVLFDIPVQRSGRRTEVELYVRPEMHDRGR